MTKPNKRAAKIYERAALRQDNLPNLYSTTGSPTLAATTTSEVNDQDIGLKADPRAQTTAERQIRAAYAFWGKQAERAHARHRPISIRIALTADDEHENLMRPDTTEFRTLPHARVEA